ncbi:arginase family protein [Jiangella aurantiaca]|uniref:arginase family protein n=1 Tax=Jiangella aurantiaca TaxID=2530373 RepID=UPI0013A5E4C1|nr:arginase family protein [Jiangella aurantiaca]
MTAPLAILGVPSGAGACGVGQHQTPAAIRAAGLIDSLSDVGYDVSDLGDSPVIPWRPDRTRPQAQNLETVVHVVQTTATRVADALHEPDRAVLVLGGDCTVGIGTIAGTQQVLGDIAVAYFDLHSDLNTPATGADGALDWMALAHMLAIRGTELALAKATGRAPLLQPSQILLFAHDMRHATRFERAEIERLGLARTAVEDVRSDPARAARQALQLITARSGRYAIHLDVDVVDFTDAPLSEHPSRNAGLKLDEMLTALKILASGPGLAAITVAELNPHNAAADHGLLERFASSFAKAISR